MRAAQEESGREKERLLAEARERDLKRRAEASAPQLIAPQPVAAAAAAKGSVWNENSYHWCV